MGREDMKHIKTWNERCEEHPDHQERIISERMIQERMQEEIDELRKREWVGLTDEELEEMHNEIKVRLMGTYRTEDIYRSIEAKLREKNT
jgi:hypothetical protein